MKNDQNSLHSTPIFASRGEEDTLDWKKQKRLLVHSHHPLPRSLVVLWVEEARGLR